MLIKTSDNITSYVLPVIIKLDNNKRIKRLRYYDNESTLFKAYRQLKAINCRMIPLYPVVYDTQIKF